MKKEFFLTFITLLYFSVILPAQQKGVYTDSERHALNTLNSSTSILLPTGSTLPFTIKEAYAIVKFDFGEDYTLGKSTGPNAFDFEIDFTLSGYRNTTEIFNENHTLRLFNEVPEVALQRKLDDLFRSAQTNGLAIDRLEISNVNVRDVLADGSSTEAESGLFLEWLYYVRYGVDVRGHGAAILPDEVNISKKTGVFTWDADHTYPNYQVQILRLYNTNELLINDESEIHANVDWNLALNFETESSETQLIATISEGTGVYIWRVRPIGTFFENGIGNNQNWGAWNIQTSGVVTSTNGPGFFYFEEPDDDKNFIFSRTYTEGNKQSEQLIYADGLQNVRQSQAYMPSKHTTLTTQALQDHLGRSSLSTLPVPEISPLEGYKEDFLSGYRLEDFDNEATYLDPNQMDLSYYNGQNNIPDAQGYAFSRTLYYNDGTGRVKEQSGVGADHRIGSNHTTRTIYGTASEDELVAFFGKEAPNPEQVQKVITIDPNNTANVAFISKEGHTIATGLTFLENDNASGEDAVFEPVDNAEPAKVMVKDKVTKNVAANMGFVSSKKLVFTEQTPFRPSYRIKCQMLENLCTDVELSCAYEVELRIHNLNEPENDIILKKSLADLPCEGPDGDTYKIVTSEDWVVVSGPVSAPQSIQLSPGVYQVEKLLRSTADPNVVISEASNRIDEQIKPLSNWINGSLSEIDCDEELFQFYHDLVVLGNAYSDGSLQILAIQQGDDHVFNFDCEGCSQTSITFDSAYWELYTNPGLQSDFELVVNGSEGARLSALPLDENNRPIVTYINTPCCELILDVRYTPPFRCPGSFGQQVARSTAPGHDPLVAEINTDFLHAPENTEVFPDFEGYAISILTECTGDVSDASDLFYDFMGGWHAGEFNDMVYHMLTDEYSCGATGANLVDAGNDNGTTEPELDDCGNPLDPLQNPSPMHAQYDCDELANCWSGIVLTLKSAYCGEFDFDDFNTGGNVSDAVDDNNNGDGSIHDDHIDDSFEGTGILIRWLARRKLSRRFRRLSAGGGSGDAPPIEDSYQLHLVEEFFRCVGHKFADIIEPGSYEVEGYQVVKIDYPHPSPEKTEYMHTGLSKNGQIPLDYDFIPGNLNYDVRYENNVPRYFNKYTNTYEDFGDRTAYYKVLGTGSNMSTVEVKIKELFPNIVHPVYAFKYYEYAPGSYPDLEAGVCYSDPNDCMYWNGTNFETVPCCVADPSLPEEQWDLSFCYADYDHPYPDRNGQPQADGDSDFKYVVNHFCGFGRITCPYTKVDWNCAQRETFYRMIKTYYEAPSDWEDLIDFDCAFMHEEHEWFVNPSLDDYDTNGAPLCVLGMDEVTQSLINAHCPDYSNSLTQALTYKDLEGNNVREISFLEREMADRITRCERTCESRRSEFRRAVVQMFQDRCYRIVDCKPPGADNLVLVEDIDAITDQIVEQCRSQCEINTYTCESKDCRQYNTKKTLFGKNNRESILELGVGGHVDENGSAIELDCIAPAGETMQSCCVNGGNWDLPCNAAPTYNLSYSQYTKVKQATEWDIELDIKTLCNERGEFVEGDPHTHYFDNAGTLLEHQEPDCSDASGDTFVERDRYEVPINNMDIGSISEPVNSPQVELILEVQEQ